MTAPAEHGDTPDLTEQEDETARELRRLANALRDMDWMNHLGAAAFLDVAADFRVGRSARSAATPDTAAQVERVRALHVPVPIYALPNTNTPRSTLAQQIEAGTATLYMRVCRECASDDVLDQIEDCEIDFSDGAVHDAAYPCATIRALDPGTRDQADQDTRQGDG